jgi:hypothetical protein
MDVRGDCDHNENNSNAHTPERKFGQDSGEESFVIWTLSYSLLIATDKAGTTMQESFDRT